MFDYWKIRGLVQVRKLDDSVAQAMRVASTTQEWPESGRHNVGKLAKASGLRASAYQIRETNHEAFEGKIYVSTCGKIVAAAECFTLAGCYSEAVAAYAKDDKISNCCLDDLLLLEEESSHFIEAAELARSWGDLLKEANLLKNDGYFREATILLLWYVCFKASWGNGNRGWHEIKVMSDQHNNLPELKKYLHASRKSSSSRGEIFFIRKIFDAHFHMHFTNVEPNKHHRHLSFTLIHFGVRECYVNGNIVYTLIKKDAEWRRNYGQKGLHKDGKRATIDAKELVFAIRSYWQSELLYVGIKVLETLEGLHKSKSNRVGRMIMICLDSRVSVALYEYLIKILKMNPKWKSFVEKFRDGGFKDVYVAPALQNVLELLEEISNAINEKKGVVLNKLFAAPMIKVELDMNQVIIVTGLAAQKLCSPKDATIVHDARKSLKVSKAEQTCDSVVVENQSDYDNTQDGTNKKGKGNKGQKSKKSKDLLRTIMINFQDSSNWQSFTLRKRALLEIPDGQGRLEANEGFGNSFQPTIDVP
nr:hypothetical protein [Tanacetum cinerariifolium]